MTGPSAPVLLAGVAVLAVGTFAARAAGPALKARVTLSQRTRQLADTAAVVLLAALAVTAALLQNGSPAGVTRPAGVLVGAVLAWRRAPFFIVVIAAAATTALLRLIS